ncbi:MAG TPA: efflux RND transporter periplasmic adaptor subunit [Vicinamibacteria bacterium]|nr:efflux RND transporter periplasmic adaptor subunit [Vicinamibacteria bacterium]
MEDRVIWRIGWLGWTSLAAGAVAVAGALLYHPPGPPATTPPPGMTVEKSGISFAPDAPQWRFLKLGKATRIGEHWTDDVPARITIDETRAWKLGVPLAGHVSRVLVELGEPVQPGQPLFAVASSEIAELRTAKEKAEVELAGARANDERVRLTVASRALPAKDGLAAQQQLRQAELEMRLADSKLASLRVSPQSDSEFVVTAPRRGVVVEKNLMIGQQVSPEAGSALVVVADLSTVWVVADVFEAQAIDVQEGAAAEVVSPSLPEVKLAGRVERVSAVINPETHTLPIRVSLENPDHLLRPNVYARVRFATRHASATVEVPASAIVSDGERQFVYVQDRPGAFARREVVTGAVHDGRVPILSGLELQETIVQQGAILLDNQIALSE